MLNTIIRYIQGYLLIQVTGYSPERFLNLCSRKQIYLWGLEPKENSYEMFITIRGFRKLKPILKKTRTKVTILNRLGLPFFFHRYRKRKVFFFGILFCLTFIYVMSLFVWNIHIEGNFTRTDEVILEFLESKHIKHGMLKKKVNCERIVKDIRKEFDDIVWVSAYVTGTRLMIQVKENTDTFPMEAAKEEPPNDIVADKDGRITSIVTRNGVPCVKPGDEVKKGDILVSGKVEVKNDAGEKEDMTTVDATITNNTEVMMSTVAGNEYAIGYCSLGSLNDTVKAVKIDGAEATTDNVSNGTYKVSRPFNIITKDNVSDVAQDFINYIMSADGQQVIADDGYISVAEGETFTSTGASGKITIDGSSSVSPVMEKLVEAYKKVTRMQILSSRQQIPQQVSHPLSMENVTSEWLPVI